MGEKKENVKDFKFLLSFPFLPRLGKITTCQNFVNGNENWITRRIIPYQDLKRPN